MERPERAPAKYLDSTVPPRWDRTTLVLVLALCAVKALVHLAVVHRYGYHGAELYFLECGRHLAWGYVDHPPLIPWIARLADELGGSLAVLRLPAIAAGVGTMIFTALLVREWGGGRAAQLLALLCLLVAPAHLRLAAMLDIPVVEIFFCTVSAYLVARALARGERWTWILAGGTLGLAILAKHSSLLWAGALAIGLLATPDRRALAGRWPWLGGFVALLLVLPNLAWQAQNELATLEFMRTLRLEILAGQGRGLFVAGQLLYFHPFALPVWLAGLVYAFRRAGLATRAATRRALVASLAATGAAIGLLTLPVLPLRTIDATLGALLGWAVPPMALTHDLHGMFGWEEHVATVERVYRSLSTGEREQATVLTGDYSQAAALNILRHEASPRAVSGNMTYYLWGPDADRGNVMIAYGLPRALLELHYRSCTESARIDAPLARPWDTDLPVYVCREPRGTMAALWPHVRRFGHTLPLPPRVETRD